MMDPIALVSALVMAALGIAVGSMFCALIELYREAGQ
jgi:hypothetical protein